MASRIVFVLDLQSIHVVFVPAEIVEPVVEAAWKKEVGDHDHDRLSLMPRLEKSGTRIEFRVAADRFSFLKPLQQWHHAASPATGIKNRRQLFAHSVYRQPVQAIQTDVTKSGGELASVEEFGFHRPALVEQNIDRGVFFDFEQLHDQGFKSCEHAPVDRSVVRSQVIFGVVSERDAGSFFGALSVGL